MNISDLRLATNLILASLVLQACGQSATDTGSESAVQPQANTVGDSTEYEWYAQNNAAGQHSVVRTGDGRVTTDLFVHWNNREYTLDNEMQLDRDGMISSQRLTGTSPFGAPIDESFSMVDGVASWHSAGEQGSLSTDGAAFYVSNESDPESMAALVRAAMQNIDGELELIPSATARVDKLTDIELQDGSAAETVSLYSIAGIDFTPTYIWLDSDMHVFGLDFGGFMGMLPKGWSRESLDTLSAAQSEQAALQFETLSAELSQPLQKALLITNVNVLDVENGRLLENHNVLIEDGTIAAISDMPMAVENAEVIDGGGRTLMPGMWDMHGHFSLQDGIMNIASGITSVRDIGNVHEQVMELTEKFAAGTVIGPTTYRSGFIDKTSSYATGETVDTLEEALRRVDWYADRGYLQIKLYSSIEPDWVAPIAERTHARGMRLSGHIPAFMSAEQAVRAGYDEIQHINMVFLNFLAGDREDTRQQIRFTLYGDKAGELDLDSDEVEDFIALLVENDVVIDPTAAIFETQLLHEPGQPDPTFAAVAEHFPIAVRRALYNPEMELTDGRKGPWGRSRLNANAMLKKLYESGVQLVPGSDHIAGFTIHRELELYTEAGIPNAAVLRMATLDSARIVGRDGQTGSIAVGKDADLVLLDGNPLADMSAVRHIALVMKGGQLFRPDSLYKAVGVKPFVASIP